MNTRSVSLFTSLFLCGGLSSGSAAVLLQSNFNSDTVGQAPSGWNAPSNTTGATMAVSSTGNGGNGLGFIDTSSNATSISTSIVANLSPANNLLRLQFDFRVDSYGSNSVSQNPRVILRSSAGLNTGLVIGFSRSLQTDGDDSIDNHLFAAPHGTASDGATSSVPSNAGNGTRIGLVGPTGWVPGFDFGTYDPDTASNNNTNGWISFDLTYDYNTGQVAGTATHGGNSTQFSINIEPNLTFSTGALLFASHSHNGTTGQPGVGTAYIDNVLVETIPEPTLALLSLPAAALFLKRRRH